MLQGAKPRIVTFLSATPADDKGAMLVNLGASLARAGNTQPGLVGLFSSYSSKQPQYVLPVDREMAMTRDVSLTSLYDTLGVYFGSAYVNDFTFQGRNWQVIWAGPG